MTQGLVLFVDEILTVVMSLTVAYELTARKASVELSVLFKMSLLVHRSIYGSRNHLQQLP
jgi:hypothetical protein